MDASRANAGSPNAFNDTTHPTCAYAPAAAVNSGHRINHQAVSGDTTEKRSRAPFLTIKAAIGSRGREWACVWRRWSPIPQKSSILSPCSRPLDLIMQFIKHSRRGKWLFLSLILLVTIFCYRLGLYMAQSSGASTARKNAEKTVAYLPPMDLAGYAERANMPPELTPEAMEEEARGEAELVTEAIGWLRNSDSEKRLDGAQQLGAYATAEAEKALAQALGADADSEVRIAAADALSRVETPSDATWKALLRAVSDKEQDVQIAALSTLQVLTAQTDDAGLIARVRKSLKKKATSRHLSFEVRDAIRDLLDELQPGQ